MWVMLVQAMNNRHLLFTLASASLLLVPSCKRNPDIAMKQNADEVRGAQKNYDRAIQSGIRDWPYPREFNKLFPKALNVISYYSGLAGEPRWSSVIGLSNRYVLRQVLPMKLDATRTTIVSMGIPETIRLAELLNPKTNANGSVTYGVKMIATLSPEDWRRLVEAKGDFNALGIKLENKQPPLEGFEHAWRDF
jgi:hypothetical protein